MNDTYKNYKKSVLKLFCGNNQDYMKCISDGLLVKRDVNFNGEPYRLLTEEEWNNKFKNK